ncbi:hypothetical protein FXO37_10229 [Capsicum annuum]|nr:hypothetical protein FXO37_10229 [Capsicum annuum]
MAVRKPGLIALFDVDGTLTAPRKLDLLYLRRWSFRKQPLSFPEVVVRCGSIVYPSEFTNSSFVPSLNVYQVSTPEMLKFMQELRKVVTVGVVGGSDLVKISEQLGSTAVSKVPSAFGKRVTMVSLAKSTELSFDFQNERTFPL